MHNDSRKRAVYHCAAVGDVVEIAMSVSAIIKTGSDPRKGPPGRQAEPAIGSHSLELHLIGVRFRRHPLVQRRYGGGETLQTLLNFRFLFPNVPKRGKRGKLTTRRANK